MHDRQIEPLKAISIAMKYLLPARSDDACTTTFSFDFQSERIVEVVVGITCDDSEQKRMEMNLASMAEISLDLARLSCGNEIMQLICPKLGDYLNLSLYGFVEINLRNSREND